jgi:hypothetical protein
MILGLSVAAFTTLHVVISLIAIVTGLVVLFGWLGGTHSNGWTAVFLATTVLTSVTGYFFPTEQLLPSHVVGALSLVVLAIALAALYVFHLAGAWRWIYIVSAATALYLNVFVAVAQAFQKLSVLHALAPNGSEPPFLVAQIVVLVIFVALGIAAVKRFYPQAIARA